MFIEGRDGEGYFLFIKREEMEKVISCLNRGKRWRRLFLVYIEGRDGGGYFLFIKREETEKVIYCLYRGKRRRR